MRSTSCNKKLGFYTDGGFTWLRTPMDWLPVVDTLPKLEWFLMEWL